MKKNKQLSSLIISVGIILTVLLVMSDTLRGRDFYFGISQLVMSFFSLMIIFIGWVIGYYPHIFVNFIKRAIFYATKQWSQIKEQISRKNVFLFSLFVVFLSIIVWFYYTVGTAIVRAFPDYIGAGSTVTLSQFIIILFAAIICVLPNFFFTGTKNSKLINFFISLLVFFVAYKLWTSLPIATNWLMRQINDNPLVIYPFSDPRRYDINVFSLLNGQGYGFGTPIQRPFYTFFWTILHVIFHHNYVDMVFAQVVFFCVLPVVAYHLGNKFGGRVTGIVIAGMIIFHEYNQIILSSEYTMINVQMVMSEIFIELFLILMTLVTMMWLHDSHSVKKALMAGAAFGLVVLLRTQAIVFLGIFLIYFLYFKFWKKENVLKPYLFFLLTFLLMITPWLTRNYIQNGYFSMDDPKYFNTVFTNNGDNELFIDVETGEDSSLIDNMKLYFFTRTGDLLTRTFVFFSNDLANSVYQFPWTMQFDTLEEYINSGASPFPHPYDRLDGKQSLVAGFQVLIILIGLIAAIQRFQLPGILPALFYFAYCFTGDILGYTAHRFIQPVEWVFFLYWGLGFAVLLSIILPGNIVFSQENGFIQSDGNKTKFVENVWIGTAFLIAVLIPALELFISVQAIPLPKLERAEAVVDEAKLVDVIPVDDDPVLIDAEFTALTGHALYPLLLKDVDDWYKWQLDTHWYVKEYEKVFEWNDDFIKLQVEKDVDTLLFQLMNGSYQDIIIEDPQIDVRINNPFLFNNAESFIYGCVRESYIEAYYMQIIRDGEYYEITSGKPIPDKCSISN